MKTNPVLSFDYSAFDFDESQIVLLEDCASGVESGAKLTVQGIMEIGKALSAAREVFGQDDKAFGKWRQGRLPWLSSDASKRFLRVHNRFSSLLEHNALVDLMPTVLYELAAPSTPESAVVEIISRVQGGEKITVAKAKETIQRAKSTVVSFPSPVSQPPQLNIPLPAPVSVDANPMMRELGVPAGWFSFGSSFHRDLQSFYDLHCSGQDRDLLVDKFVSTLPPDIDLTCIWQMSDLLVKLIAALPKRSKSHG